MCKTAVKDPPFSLARLPAHTPNPISLFSVLKSHFIFSKYTENSKHMETKDFFVCSVSSLNPTKSGEPVLSRQWMWQRDLINTTEEPDSGIGHTSETFAFLHRFFMGGNQMQCWLSQKKRTWSVACMHRKLICR